MLFRCYSNNKENSYKDVTVCESWHNFQNFAKWFEENYNPETMQGWHLDKDVFTKKDKIYSPKTCCFIPAEINTMLVSNSRFDDNVGIRKRKNVFQARYTKNKKEVNIGHFKTKELAIESRKSIIKNELLIISNKWRKEIGEKVYEKLINYLQKEDEK